MDQLVANPPKPSWLASKTILAGFAWFDYENL
jgi:hypothetical protein